MKTRLGMILLLVVAGVAPMHAQPDERGKTEGFRSEIELQLFRFGNFFQAREGEPRQNVNGYGTEYRAAWRSRPDAPDIYGAAYVLNYGDDAGETTYGGRVGIARYGSVHSFNAYVDRAENAFAFEVADQTASGSITAYGGSYSIRVARDWQFGVDTYNERQRFDVETGFENDYHNIGVQARYRGFGDLVEPRIGFVTGERDVRDRQESFDDRYWYLQLTSEPHPRIVASLRYRNRTRDYQNIDRSDDRDQWMLRGLFRQSERVSWAAAYTHESVDSSLPGRDFDTSVGYVGVVIGF